MDAMDIIFYDGHCGLCHRWVRRVLAADREGRLFHFSPLQGELIKNRLSEQERAMLRARDWRALIHYGAIFFLLEKLGAVVGTTNLHIYAAMRGQPLEEFLKTRNTQVLYSVAAQK